MTDTTVTDTPPVETAPAPHPSGQLSSPDLVLATAPQVDEPVSDPVTAKTKLRTFEDEAFGKDVGRINGEVERGVGSPFARMTPEQKKQHAALERLVVAEQKLADASQELSKAESAHAAAVKEAEASEQAADEPVKPQPEPVLAEH